ncbi:MAG: hypothetical protein F4Z01_01670 [Gammaproteobacteria bacterium]|nr:hypothetical protein [Gammaproteobacteria bacterium]MYF37846.1 hypothetical protein [Gammaproteobacteria bacterium]
MKRITTDRRWFLIITFGSGLVVVAVICMLLFSNSRLRLEEVQSLGISDLSGSVPSSLTTKPPVVSVESPPQLPYVEFPPGSVEEACGLNKFPPRVGYYDYEDHERSGWSNTPFNAEGDWIALESEECRTALENHINAINPYLWGTSRKEHQFVFIVLDNPLTFARIFADPGGDLLRVQDALSRSECLLTGDETNWELKETCHADAFLNFALINRFCFDQGVRNRSRTYYWKENNPTPEQDRFMWKQSLEDAWVNQKCEELDQTLRFTSEQNSEIYNSVISLRDSTSKSDRIRSKSFSALLIELAARLGDDAAGLTKETLVPYSHHYDENGYKYGRFAGLLSSTGWRVFTAINEPPSADRFLQTFNMLALVRARKPDPRDEIEFDWEFVARHLCEPPYYVKWWYDAQIKALQSRPEWAVDLVAFREKYDNPKNCQQVIHELRQRADLKFAPLLQTLDKFEQVALELDVYE